MHFITDDQVRGTLSVPEASAVIARAFAAYGRGDAANLGRVRARCAGATISAMGAAWPEAGVLGAKVYPTIDGRFNFVVPLFAAADGELLAVVQGNALTELRTCATTVVAARAIADPDAGTLAVFGSGVQASAHARALVQAFPIRRVRVVDPHGDAAGLASDLGRAMGVQAEPVATAREALAEADIVVTATRSPVPLFDADAVRPGTFVAAIGSSKPDTRELPAALLRRAACVLVEDRDCLAETGDLAEASEWPQRLFELGPLLAGTQAFARTAGDVTVYKSVGIGLEDVAVAHGVYQRLREAGR